MLKEALSLHQEGKLGEAAALYRKILSQNPRDADALYLLGVIEFQRKNILSAIELIDRAIKIRPNNAEFFYNRGNALGSLERFHDAIASYDGALVLKPDYAEAFYNRGIALRAVGRLDDALASYDRALAIKPDYCQALNNRGIALRALKRFDDALASYDRALVLKPDYAEALNNRGVALRGLKRFEDALASYDRALAILPDYGEALVNRGNALRDLNRFDDALACYDRALALVPDYAEAFYNRGIALQALKRFDDALASYDRALAIKPDFAEALCNRGVALGDLNRFDEALASYDRALALVPDYAEALSNRGMALGELNRFDEALVSHDRALALLADLPEALVNRGMALTGLKRIDEALASFDRALTIKPGYAEAFYNRAMTRLLGGHYRDGWEDFEWRWKSAAFPITLPKISARQWRGEDLGGRSILIFVEQGFGDIIQFARFLPLLVERGARVSFLAPIKLIRLLRPLGDQVEFISSMEARKSFDFHCALMSLPLRLGIELGSIPNQVPYLKPEDDLISRWKQFIGGSGFKIGIAWQGNPHGRVDRGRSFPLSGIAPLARLPGVRLISLQKHHGLDQLMYLPAGAKVESLGNEFDGGVDAFIDTAAIMSNLDLIITSDTSIAHLAGALGCPTWVALKYVPDWRWLLNRDDSPWYPTMRLFRQETPGDWEFVFSKIEQELRSRRASPADAGLIASTFVDS